MLVRVFMHPLGAFSTTSPLIITDPCLPECGLSIDVRAGRWHVLVSRKKTKSFGMKVAMLMLVHDDVVDSIVQLEWDGSAGQVGVEGGLLGAWDAKRYGEEGDEFASRCVKLTRPDEMKVVMDLLPTLPPFPKPTNENDGGEEFRKVFVAREEAKSNAIRMAYDECLGVGVMDFGVVCVPGLGDGVYNVKTKLVDDVVVGVSLNFLSDFD